jgi:2'-5' RNA ligase
MRAFIAVDVPEGIRAVLSSAADMLGFDGIRLVQENNLHITMLFLGDIDESRVDDIKGIISKVNPDGFEVSLEGLGVFTPRMPKVIFAKVVDHSRSLLRTYNFLRAGVERLGLIVEDRQYIPHVTLGRLTGTQNLGYAGIEESLARIAVKQSFRCTGISLKSSILSQDGPIYKNLYSLPV